MLTMELLIEILGWVGAACVLGAYVLVSLKRLAPDSGRFQALNLGGSFLLAGYAWWHGAMASVAVNVVWFAIGVLALVTVVRQTK